MSPPSANTRSGNTPTKSEIRSLTEAEPINVSAMRQELLGVFMNPKAHEDPESRKDFSRKLFQYTKLARPPPSDIIFQIASEFFGMRQFKVVLVGSGGVGKSAFVSRHVNNQFIYKYESTRGAEVTPIVLVTTQGDLIKFDVWDTAGVEKHGKLKDGYYVGSDAAVLMYDVTSKASYKELTQLHTDLVRVCKNIPIVVAGNKADVKKEDRKVKADKVKFPRKHCLRHFELSTKSGLNLDQPFLSIARALMGNNRLRFDTVTGTHNPEVQSGDESDVATAASQLSLEDPDVAGAKLLPLPPSNDSDGGL